jgi:pteridine reductase
MELKDKTALVTGGARRIGLSLCLALAHRGTNVVLHYHRSEREARQAKRRIEDAGAKCWLTRADLADAESVGNMLVAVGRDCPPVDVLVNNASVYHATPLTDLNAAQWDEFLNTNLRAPFLLCRELGLAMKQRGAGKIINLADAAVWRPYKGHLPYLISKAGLVTLTQILALELAPEVQVNAVAPGTVLLPDAHEPALAEAVTKLSPLRRVGTPEDVVALVLFLIEKGNFMTGGVHPVDGGAGMRTR